VTTTTESIPPAEALAEIREIINNIKSGKYLHNQSSYCNQTFCGTAHCIAGWKIYRDAKSVGLKTWEILDLFDSYGELEGLYQQVVSTVIPFCLDPWGYAERAWGLTPKQSEGLFGADLSIETIDHNLSELEALATNNP
jgi:hypothetical protein